MTVAKVSNPMLVRFHGCADGEWRVTSQIDITGPAIERPTHVTIGADAHSALWTLSGFTSNLRYTTANERSSLTEKSAPLGRTDAKCAALIPIRKSPAWWALAQDERIAIYQRSAHTPIGMEYLPAISRRLHHSRDLGEPFDFLTWFEYSGDHEAEFDDLLARLRMSEEWRYVDREIDIRLVQA